MPREKDLEAAGEKTQIGEAAVPKDADAVEQWTDQDAERMESQANTNAVSRAIAVMLLMLLPGVAGSYLDRWLGTEFLVVIGFVLGIGIAIFGLLYVAKIADVASKKSKDLRTRSREKAQGNKSENPSKNASRS